MKRFISWMLIGIAALGLSLGAMAGVSDTGAYLGVAQTFAGVTDSYIGYTFGNVIQTSAFSVQFNVDEVFDDGYFLEHSTFGFGLLYEYNVDALNLEIYADTKLNNEMDNFANWGSGIRAEFLVLPNPCDTPGPCYNPELKIFTNIGITQESGENPEILGEVGFEVHL